MNHFQLFDLPVQFELDTVSLAEKYRQLQRQYHPDRFASEGEHEQMAAMQKAAHINDAYQTLKSTTERAQYLLSLNGIELSGETQTLRDPQFLIQQMEWREQLAEIPHTGDPEEALDQFSQNLARETHCFIQIIERQLNDRDWTNAADTVRKLKFMNKLEAEVSLLEDKLFDF